MNDPDFMKLASLALVEILFNQWLDLSWGESVEIERVFDGQLHCRAFFVLQESLFFTGFGTWNNSLSVVIYAHTGHRYARYRFRQTRRMKSPTNDWVEFLSLPSDGVIRVE